jgi:hypothetical protein
LVLLNGEQSVRVFRKHAMVKHVEKEIENIGAYASDENAMP